MRTTNKRASVAPSAVASSNGIGAAATTGTAIAINRQRIPQTIDFLGTADDKISAAMRPFREAAVSRVYLGLSDIQNSLKGITTALNGGALPPQVIGVLHEPDGLPAARVQVTFDPTPLGGKPPVTVALTDANGGFTIPMPSTGALMPAAGLKLSVHGGNANVDVTVGPKTVAPNGVTSVITLPSSGRSSADQHSAGAREPAAEGSDRSGNGGIDRSGEPALGENRRGRLPAGIHRQRFDRFIPLQRLHPLGRTPAEHRQRDPVGAAGRGVGLLPAAAGLPDGGEPVPGAFTSTSYADRVPVEQPLSVDGFRDQIMGLEFNGTFGADETVPMAATLGLGYVLEMQQRWTFAGVGARRSGLFAAAGARRTDPGGGVRAHRYLGGNRERDLQRKPGPSSNRRWPTPRPWPPSTRPSARLRAAAAPSTTEWSSGGFSIPCSVPAAAARQSIGASENWMQGQRDTTEAAAQTTHSAASNQASARRSAARTGMRLASASENGVGRPRKTITNHNHAHALTMQYWEVLRNYNVTTVIDGLTLALPGADADRALRAARPAATHADRRREPEPAGAAGALCRVDQAPRRPAEGRAPAVPVRPNAARAVFGRSHRHGRIRWRCGGGRNRLHTDGLVPALRDDLDPRASPGAGRGRPGPADARQDVAEIPPDTFASKDEVLAWLGDFRRAAACRGGDGKLALPLSMNRADIVGFEIMRNFEPSPTR